MKKILAILLLLVWGCHQQRNKQDEKPVILVSILPERTFIEKIGGDDFRVTVLIPHGANPTTYSLLPVQMAEISSARVWFRMGYVGFELSWGERIRETNPGMKIVDLSKGLDLVTGSSPENKDDKAGTDPHTWLSPVNVRIMAKQILDELILMHPAKAGEYMQKYRQFLEEIDRTDAEIKKILEHAHGKKFITYHPSLTYFARDYGLIQMAIEQGGKEPTPAHLAQLAKTAKADGIRVIYIQSDYDRDLAGVFAEEIDGSVIQIWPLNPDWSGNLISLAGTINEN